MPNKEDILWFKRQFQDEIKEAVKGTPFSLDMIAALACQETGYIWQELRKNQLSLGQILELCEGFASVQYLKPASGITMVPAPMPAPTPPSSGIVAVHMPRKQDVVTRRANLPNAHSLNEPKQPTIPQGLCRGLATSQLTAK